MSHFIKRKEKYMENENLLIGKTIESLYLDESGDEDKIVLYFTDGNSVHIKSNANNFLYSLFIEKE